MKQQKSVLLVTEGTYPGTPGGVSEWCQRLVTGMPRVNFKIVSISANPTFTQPTQLPPNVSELTLLPLWDSDVHFYRFSNGSNLRKEIYEFDSKESRWLKGSKNRLNILVNGLAPESPFEGALNKIAQFPVPASMIIHAMNSGLAGLLGLKGKWKHRVPLIITEHGVYYKEWVLSTRLGACVSKERCWGTNMKRFESSRILLNQIKQIVRNTLEGADLVLPVTATHIPWELSLGAHPEHINIIPNGVDTHKFQPDSIETTERIMVGSICRITPIKDIHTLIFAAHNLIRQVQRAEFHLIGPIENKRYFLSCCELIEDLGLDGRFLIHRATHQPEEWYRRFDLFALSSISEGMPLALLEAMATGVPAVVTDVGGVREVMWGMKTLVPPKQPEIFAKALQRALHMDRRKQSIQIRHRVQKWFSEVQMIQRYANIYFSLSKNGRNSHY